MYRLIAISLSFAIAAMAAADSKHFEILEHAAEVMTLDLEASEQQLLYAKRCDQCETVAVSIDKDTRVFDGRRPITMGQAAGFESRGATIFFDPKTRRVSRIVYWPIEQQDS